MLAWAFACEERSEHPVRGGDPGARARAPSQSPARRLCSEALPGRGVSIRSGARLVRAGSLPWLREERASRSRRTTRRASRRPARCSASRWTASFSAPTGWRTPLRPSAAAAVKAAQGPRPRGLPRLRHDRNAAAYRVAEQVGIGKVFAEVRPEEKADIVRRFQEEGKKVAMVGEGFFNDAPALSHADVGIALAAGADVAIEAADLTLMNPDLTSLTKAMELSQRIRAVIRQNLAWAFAVQASSCSPSRRARCTRGGGSPPSFVPEYAGAAMALSSISVALNSLRLRRRSLRPLLFAALLSAVSARASAPQGGGATFAVAYGAAAYAVACDPNATAERVTVRRLGLDGGVLWEQRYGTGRSETPVGAAVTSWGGVSVAGDNDGGCFAAHWASNGARKWEDDLQYGSECHARAVLVDANGDTYVLGDHDGRRRFRPERLEDRQARRGPFGRIVPPARRRAYAFRRWDAGRGRRRSPRRSRRRALLPAGRTRASTWTPMAARAEEDYYKVLFRLFRLDSVTWTR